MTAILDLNDIALRLWHEGNCAHSPGFAWFDGTGYHFGEPAQRTSRRTPRTVNTRFWSQLDTETLTPALGPARHAADLAHSHLAHLHRQAGEPRRVIIAAPGSMNRDQLSLLLGIIQTLPFDIAGLVHRTGVLAAASGLASGDHVELQLHQIAVTPFETDAGHVHAGSSKTLPGEGLLTLLDRLATVIAQLFVSQTRFDPLRSAESEQALYDGLPEVLEALRDEPETSLALNGYRVSITRDDLAPIGATLADKIAPLLSERRPVLIEHPLTLLPGLDLGRPSHAIDSQAIVGLVTEHLPALEQATDALMLRRKVPLTEHPVGQAVSGEDTGGAAQLQIGEPTPRPTHLLRGHVATPLAHETDLEGGGRLHFEGDVLTLAGSVAGDLLINDKPARPGQILVAGDRLSDSLGFRAQLIVVGD